MTGHDRTGLRGLGQRLRGWWPVIGVAAAIIAAGVLTAGPPERALPLDPSSTGPDGTSALVGVLRALDRDVDTVGSADIGDSDVVLLLRDQLTDAGRAALRERIADGARVVVTDPASPLVPEAAGSTPVLGDLRRGTCAVDAVADVGEVAVGGDAVYDVPADGAGCFTTTDGAWLVVTPRGRGHVVALGGPGLMTNRRLGAADNAVLAAQILAPAGAGRITVVRPVLVATGGDGGQGLGDLIPRWVRVAALQLLVGFLVLVAWRARRLGPPLVDTSPVRLSSAELTAAVGALLARHRLRGDATARIVADGRRRIATGLGLPATADADEVAAAVEAATGRPAATTVATLTPASPPDDPAMLTAVGDLADLEHTVLRPQPTTLEPVDVH